MDFTYGLINSHFYIRVNLLPGMTYNESKSRKIFNSLIISQRGRQTGCYKVRCIDSLPRDCTRSRKTKEDKKSIKSFGGT